MLILTLWPLGNHSLLRPAMRLGSSAAIVWLAFGFLCLVQARESRAGELLLVYALALGGAAGLLVYSDPMVAVACIVPVTSARILTLRQAWRRELPIWLAFVFGTAALFFVAKAFFEPLVGLTGCADVLPDRGQSLSDYIANFGDFAIRISRTPGRIAVLFTILTA